MTTSDADLTRALELRPDDGYVAVQLAARATSGGRTADMLRYLAVVDHGQARTAPDQAMAEYAWDFLRLYAKATPGDRVRATVDAARARWYNDPATASLHPLIGVFAETIGSAAHQRRYGSATATVDALIGRGRPEDIALARRVVERAVQLMDDNRRFDVVGTTAGTAWAKRAARSGHPRAAGVIAAVAEARIRASGEASQHPLAVRRVARLQRGSGVETKGRAL